MTPTRVESPNRAFQDGALDEAQNVGTQPAAERSGCELSFRERREPLPAGEVKVRAEGRFENARPTDEVCFFWPFHRLV